MLALADQQGQFARAVLNPELDVPGGIVDPDGAHSVRRFSVYRNNVVSGLIDCLAEAYPAVAKITGEEFFRAMARIFVSAHPPQSPIMHEYGAGFAEFVASFPPAAGLAYLADVARLERAYVESYHAADATPVTGADLAKLGQSRFAQLQLTLHPALRFLASPFPALTIWTMNRENRISTVDLAVGEEALITRPDAVVTAHHLPKGTVALLACLQAGKTLEAAAQASWEKHPDFDITQALTGLMTCGAFVGWVEGA